LKSFGSGQVLQPGPVPSRVLPDSTCAPARPVAGRSAKANPGARWALLMVICGILLTVTIVGMPYYLSGAGQRVRSPMHDWLKPSGWIGQAAGFLALGLFLYIWLYPLRKKFRFLAFTGSMARWLDLHILAGLLLPWIGAVHAGFRFTGLIGMAYISMLLVSLSGVVGRYLYTHIPRTASGIAMNKDQANAERARLMAALMAATGIEQARLEKMLLPETRIDSAAGAGLGGALKVLLTSDLARFRALRRLRKRWSRAGLRRGPVDRNRLRSAVKLARKEIALNQRLRMLGATERLFRFWHVVHRPFAVTALVGVLVHVGVVVFLGVTWLG